MSGKPSRRERKTKARRERPERRSGDRPGSRDGSAEREGVRLQRLISQAGIASRRAAEELILSRRVTVNGRVAALGQRALPGDDVRVDGKQLAPPPRNVTIMLNKPPGFVTTARDERGRRTVFALTPPVKGLHPVGRLDRDSEGLLLLTTDGDLTLRLTHPRYGVEKEYRVWLKEGRAEPSSLQRLVTGVQLEDGFARAASAWPAPGGAVVVLKEGRKRQVRRLFKAIGATVERLMRTRIGQLELGELRPGEQRELKGEELKLLGYNPR